MIIFKTTAPNKWRIHIPGKRVGHFQELTVEHELQKGMNFWSILFTDVPKHLNQYLAYMSAQYLSKKIDHMWNQIALWKTINDWKPLMLEINTNK